MKALSNVSKVIILAVVAAILIILAIVYQGGNSAQNVADETPAAVTANAPAQTPTSTATSSPKGTGVKTSAGHIAVPIVSGPPAPVISIITPVGNDVWTIGTKNVISWNQPGKISGSISLINESNQAFVGIILPQIGPNQTSYTWNTLSVSLNRTDPSGKDITPGLYEVELTYDGNNIKPVTSFPFSIIN